MSQSVVSNSTMSLALVSLAIVDMLVQRVVGTISYSYALMMLNM